MDPLSVVVGLLTVAFGVAFRMLWVAIGAESLRVEEDLMRELESALKETAEQISNQLDSLAGPLHDMPSPMETIELMRANLMNTLMELGVGWVGKKFGMDMGVHSIENPDHTATSIDSLPSSVEHGPTPSDPPPN